MLVSITDFATGLAPFSSAVVSSAFIVVQRVFTAASFGLTDARSSYSQYAASSAPSSLA